MTKNTGAIDRTRMQRTFVGTHTEQNPTNEYWYEDGHFYQGVELTVEPITEQDQDGRKGSDFPDYDDLGFVVTGSGEHAQNDAQATAFYRNVMNGKRNVAFLVGTRLILFRLKRLNGLKLQDNRIYVHTKLNYSGKHKWPTEFSGSVDNYEIIFVKPSSVKIVGNALKYELLNPSGATDNSTTGNNIAFNLGQS